MSEFTKGKWIYDDESNYIFNDNKQMTIAQIRGWGYLTQKLGLSDDEAYEVQQANARLIAAAPEMYELLKKFAVKITVAGLLNKNQIFPVNPVLVESAKRLISRIDSEEE
ncbi:MAG: hypothetical protein IJ597_03490 [Synergistaceae bacterium]|nr:hypothetical protein [Synergistaceae bacterium]